MNPFVKFFVGCSAVAVVLFMGPKSLEGTNTNCEAFNVVGMNILRGKNNLMSFMALAQSMDSSGEYVRRASKITEQQLRNRGFKFPQLMCSISYYELQIMSLTGHEKDINIETSIVPF